MADLVDAEVIKGGFRAPHGPSAMIGVSNMHTKRVASAHPNRRLVDRADIVWLKRTGRFSCLLAVSNPMFACTRRRVSRPAAIRIAPTISVLQTDCRQGQAVAAISLSCTGRPSAIERSIARAATSAARASPIVSGQGRPSRTLARKKASSEGTAP